MTLPIKLAPRNLTASLGHEKCENYLLFRFETSLGEGLRAFLYLAGLAYCFIGLSAITNRFFRSMENVVKHSRKVVVTDPVTKVQTVRYDKVWNYAIADITLLAFGTSFPQISLATIDAIRNIGSLYAGAGELKKISDIGVWLVELFWSFWAYIWLYIILKSLLLTGVDSRCDYTLGIIVNVCFVQNDFRGVHLSDYLDDDAYLSFSERSDRPLEWVPEEPSPRKHEKLIEDYLDLHQVADLEGNDTVDIYSIHSGDVTGASYKALPENEDISSAEPAQVRQRVNSVAFLLLWREQFVDALMFGSHKLDSIFVRWARVVWHFLLLPWRVLFAFVPPYHVAHGWIAFIGSLCFISGIAYVVTKLSDLISCVTGINPYVIAFTALAAGTSWPDLWASKIAAERQTTADSAIANITCSNSVNIYVGIGIPWLIHTTYNFFAYHEPLRIEDAGGLSFSLLIFFTTSAGCIAVLVVRRLVFGAELGGPRVWAWVASLYFMLLWLIFVTLSSLKVSGFF
ncbi:hypothetical protein Cgig2_002689 [Carnegiea gigantea]|uniref:Sodium/calcium exchanger membrane region domain-containing protein n=1 Tax=Carnegiea gigantea TaxID=171969 RepID=A0A9Q1JLD8_9CARY|nr:hypothetical protein Cgig2_002689 [Carnegiea gigantea]